GERDDGARAFFAFEQHYALNVLESKGSALDAWTNWEPAMRASFPTAQSLLQVVRENPGAFAWHVGRNALGFPVAIWELLSPVPYWPLALSVLLVVAAAVVIVLGSVGLRAHLRDADGHVRRLVPFVAIVALGAIVSVGLVYPRQ